MKKTNALAKFEPTAKILAANAFSQSLSFCMERKYLHGITSAASSNPFVLRAIANISAPLEPMWIKIHQVGKPLNDKVEDCFTAIQKILYSCFLPHQIQLLFLLVGDGVQNHLYLGVRALDAHEIKRSFVDKLNGFITGLWPGLSTSLVKDSDDPNLSAFRKDCSDSGRYDCFYAVTGIPSMESQYKTTYPATIDKLMAGMNSKKYSYLVVADPIAEEAVDAMLYSCRDMDGQAESLKSFNFSEGTQHGTSESLSKSHSICKSTSTSTTKRDNSGLGGKAASAVGVISSAAGLVLAASMFPPAAAMLPAALKTAASGASVLASGAGSVGINLLSCMIPTKSESIGESISDSESRTTGYSDSQSQSISSNVVNKHVEAVADHLFYHSKRLEGGKATGMWKVGVYMMAEKESDIKGGTLQLRAILSGQESIFEPIRIHNISDMMNNVCSGYSTPLRDASIAQIAAPSMFIDNAGGGCLAHPLGIDYQELKTVLTTKELSYLVNFPMRSVPGISVIDSTPEFSLNQQMLSDEAAVDLGNLLYGGSATKIPYKIPFGTLSRHTLLSGINGSGKTNTVQVLLDAIQNELPYLVIEPAKTEYVDWALSYNKLHPDSLIDIYIPGCRCYKSKAHPEGYALEQQLKINPFDIVWLSKDQEPNVLTHIDRLKSTFAAAFPMYDVLPILMEDLIYTVYQNKSTDWLNRQPEFGKSIPPTLNSMKISVDRVIANHRYEERIERNMKACLNTRIDTLMRGWKGDMLNTLHSTDWETLFERPCIINLSYVGDDGDKAFFMALILQFLYEYRTACAETGRMDFNDNGCRHLTVIEEAHRVMANCTNPELPQHKTAMMFSNMLSEIRAYGEGLFLVDQVPTRLIPDAIKNTNLKITHRLVAEDDCKAVGEAMGLTQEQRKIISKLQIGQCIVSGSSGTDTHWVKVHKMK